MVSTSSVFVQWKNPFTVVRMASNSWSVPATDRSIEEEIVSLYDRLAQHMDEVRMAESHAVDRAHFDAESKKNERLSQNMPTVEQLVSFILSKPKYEHDIIEVENHFLKQRITSRDNPTLYRKLSFDLQKARKVIEAQKGGAFDQQATPSKNLKKYVFRPLSRSLTEVFIEKRTS